MDLVTFRKCFLLYLQPRPKTTHRKGSALTSKIFGTINFNQIFSFGNSDAPNQNQQGNVYGNDDDDEDLYG